MGNLGTEEINAERFGLYGAKPNKIIVTLPDSKEKIHIEVPCVQNGNRDSVFIPWYYFENLTVKPDTFTIQADQINSTEVIIEFVQNHNYKTAISLKAGDILKGFITTDNETITEGNYYVFDANGNYFYLGETVEYTPGELAPDIWIKYIDDTGMMIQDPYKSFKYFLNTSTSANDKVSLATLGAIAIFLFSCYNGDRMILHKVPFIIISDFSVSVDVQITQNFQCFFVQDNKKGA